MQRFRNEVVYFDDDQFKYTNITKDYVGPFYQLLEMDRSPEFVRYCIAWAEMGNSIIAIEKKTGKVVGVAVNSLLEREVFCKRFDICFRPMNAFSGVLHSEWLMVLPAYRNKGIGTQLCYSSYRIAKTLAKNNMPYSIQFPILDSSIALRLDMIFVTPCLISNVFTSFLYMKTFDAEDFE